MVKRSYRLEEVVAKLRQVDVLHRQGQRMTIADAVRDIGVSEVMFYRWHEHHGGINTVQMKHIKELEEAKVAPVFYRSARFRGLGGKRASTSTAQGALSPFS